MLRSWRLWLGLVISISFLYWVVQQVSDFGHVGGALAAANYIYLVPALVFYFFGVWLRAIRWHYLLRPMKAIAAGRLFPVVVIGYMANDVLPARMGEVVRVYVLGEKEQVSKSASFATIVVERLFDGATMLLFMAVISLFVPFEDRLQQVLRLTGLLFVVLLIAFYLAAVSQKRALKILDLGLVVLPSALRATAVRRIGSFLSGLSVLRSGRLVAMVTVFSIGAWLSEAGMYYIITFSFDLPLPFYVLVLTTAVANLGTMVPSSPGYVGTFEALSVFTLGLFGVAPALAMSYTIVLHVALLVPVTLLGFYYLWQYGISLRVAAREEQGTTGVMERNVRKVRRRRRWPPGKSEGLRRN